MSAEEGNKYAEKWTLKEATELFDDALEMSEGEDYDFIGEIAKELKAYKELFTYISEKFPELKEKHKQIKSNCEATCFYNGKKNKIDKSMAIMNLKSNHGWTDRVDNTTKGDAVVEKTDLSSLTNEELIAYKQIQSKIK